MTPRHKVQWLDSNESPEALSKLVGASKHAFLPVMRGDTDEVLGVVDLRELLWRYQKTGRFSLEASVVPSPWFSSIPGFPMCWTPSGSIRLRWALFWTNTGAPWAL